MKCYECGGEHKEHCEKRFRVDDETIGTFHVADVSYMECGKCRDRLFAPADAKKIEDARAGTLNGILQAMPLRSFFSAAETSEKLGISRQALHKHRRISRGFIYHTEFGGARVYLKKSVLLFLESGDGRFTLRQPESKPVTYEDNPQVSVIPPVLAWEIRNGVTKNAFSFSKPIRIEHFGQTEIVESSYA